MNIGEHRRSPFSRTPSPPAPAASTLKSLLFYGIAKSYPQIYPSAASGRLDADQGIRVGRLACSARSRSGYHAALKTEARRLSPLPRRVDYGSLGCGCERVYDVARPHGSAMFMEGRGASQMPLLRRRRMPCYIEAMAGTCDAGAHARASVHRARPAR